MPDPREKQVRVLASKFFFEKVQSKMSFGHSASDRKWAAGSRKGWSCRKRSELELLIWQLLAY